MVDRALVARRCARLAIQLAAASAFLPFTCFADVALPALRDEIVTRASVDQFLRLNLDRSTPDDRVAWQRIGIVDRSNTQRMRVVIAQYGWPTRAMVGDDGAAAAWLLVQHADQDPAFQQRCLALIEAQPAGEVSGESRALLTDRVLLARGAKQRFGSQFEGNCTSGFTIQPLEEPDKVDERRASYGLPSLAAYVDFAKTVFCPTKPEQ